MPEHCIRNSSGTNAKRHSILNIREFPPRVEWTIQVLDVLDRHLPPNGIYCRREGFALRAPAADATSYDRTPGRSATRGAEQFPDWSITHASSRTALLMLAFA